MKNKILPIFIIVVAAASIDGAFSIWVRNSGKIYTNTYLSYVEIFYHQVKMEMGDVESARRLYYFYSDNSTDAKKRRAVMRKLAELGDSGFQHVYASFLLDNGKYEEGIRWLEISSKTNPESKERLEKLKAKKGR